jgi:ribonuclease HI
MVIKQDKITQVSNIHVLFTDGACSGNPGPGGWGVVWILPDDTEQEFGGHKDYTTNNEMELTAVVEGLKRLQAFPGEVEIRTDSQYVQKGMTEWISNWERRGWKNADNKQVKNLELWKELLAIVRGRRDPVTWTWVRGHSGNHGNERADAIATRMINA